MERYDRYRDSGVEWIGEIPSNWKILPLKYCYNFKTGFTPDTKQYEYYDPNGYDWATISDLGGSEIRNTETRISQRFVDEFNPVPILKGSLLYSFKLSTGKVAFAGKDLFTNEAIASFLPNNPCLCFLKYSSYLISFAANENIYGAKLLNASLIKNALMVFPPISVQEKIASFLEEKTSVIDSLIQKNEKSIELLQDYRKSVISEAVTKGLDPNVPMKDSGIEWIGKIPEEWNCFKLLYALEMPITDGPHETPVFYEQGIPFISADAIKNGKVDFSRMRGYISYEYHLSCSRKYSPKPGDIYMIKSGATTGQLGYVDFDGVFDIWSPLAAIRVNNGYSSKFLFYALSSDYFQKQVEEAWSFGTQQNLSMRKLEQLKVVFPKISVQYEIANYLDSKIIKIDSLIEKKKQLVEKLQEYRKSLISECVTGKVKVPGVE